MLWAGRVPGASLGNAPRERASPRPSRAVHGLLRTRGSASAAASGVRWPGRGTGRHCLQTSVMLSVIYSVVCGEGIGETKQAIPHLLAQDVSGNKGGGSCRCSQLTLLGVVLKKSRLNNSCVGIQSANKLYFYLKKKSGIS